MNLYNDLVLTGTFPLEKYFEYNAKLQQKKNALRAELSEKGILKRDGNNTYDHYNYFSEAQYKELFTGLFSKHKLESNFTEIEYSTFEGSEKQANGRMPKIEFYLIDTETGFFETSVITGEGIDKGDKAGYKADTGALKYYLALKFMVATGDDPEKESPNYTMNDKKPRGKTHPNNGKATPKQIAMLKELVNDVPAMLKWAGVNTVEEMSKEQASVIIGKKLNNKQENVTLNDELTYDCEMR